MNLISMLVAITLVVIFGLIFGISKRNKKIILISSGIFILLISFSLFLIFVLIPSM